MKYIINQSKVYNKEFIKESIIKAKDIKTDDNVIYMGYSEADNEIFKGKFGFYVDSDKELDLEPMTDKYFIKAETIKGLNKDVDVLVEAIYPTFIGQVADGFRETIRPYQDWITFSDLVNDNEFARNNVEVLDVDDIIEHKHRNHTTDLQIGIYNIIAVELYKENGHPVSFIAENSGDTIRLEKDFFEQDTDFWGFENHKSDYALNEVKQSIFKELDEDEALTIELAKPIFDKIEEMSNHSLTEDLKQEIVEAINQVFWLD